MANLFEKTGINTEPSLFAGIEGQIIDYGVMLAAKQGVLTRGSVLKEDKATKTFSLIGAIPTETDNVFVLGETVDTGDAGATDAVLSKAYAAGIFNRDVIFLGTGIELSMEAEEILRDKGIYLDFVVPASGPVGQ